MEVLIGFGLLAALWIIVIKRLARRVRRMVARPAKVRKGQRGPRPKTAGTPAASATDRSSRRHDDDEPRRSPPADTPQPEKRFIKGRAYVIDGDSLRIKGTEVRLFGIDAPEFNHPYGKTAKSALISLCKGQQILAEVICDDLHGRAVARCTLSDGCDLSAEMVRKGLAIDWPKHSGGVYRHLEPDGIRKKLWLADARQKGRMDVWARFDAQRAQRSQSQAAPKT